MMRSLVLLIALSTVLLLTGCEVPESEPNGDPSPPEEAPAVEEDTEATPAAEDDSEGLRITMIDVGQGDAVLLESPEGQTVLYDGGPARGNVLDQLRGLEVESIDLVIASHPHEDHIGGLRFVIEAYEPELVIDSGMPHTTRAYERYLDAIEAAGSQLLDNPERQPIEFGPATLELVPPPQNDDLGLNDNSVGFILTYGDFQASFYGDAEHDQFEWLLEHHSDLFPDVQVHKASHHASRNGDVREVVEQLRPDVVIAGIGQDNRYGHPHDEALLLYEAVGADFYSTDRHGSIQIDAYTSGRFEIDTALDAEALAEARCVNINQAAPDELERLTNVGASTAEGIVATRPFGSIADLERVSGLAESTVTEIKDQGLACVEE